MNIKVESEDQLVAEQAVIVCMPVSMMAEPGVPSDQTDCMKCGETVWISQASAVPLVERGLRCICVMCAVDEPPGELKVTSKIMREVKDAIIGD